MKYLYLISTGITVHTVPHGTDPFRAIFLAVNCQATMTGSLRDKDLPDTCPRNRTPLGPVDDEYENEERSNESL